MWVHPLIIGALSRELELEAARKAERARQLGQMERRNRRRRARRADPAVTSPQPSIADAPC